MLISDDSVRDEHHAHHGKQRSHHSSAQAPVLQPELKLQVVAACARHGASIAAVAMQRDINANIVHRWLREHRQGLLVNPAQTFVPVRVIT